MRYSTCVMLMAVLMLVASAAYAAPVTFTVTLLGSNENPPSGSPGTGFATVVLDPTAQTLQLNVTFSNLTTPDIAAHIHCCLPSPFSPNNVGVATVMPVFPGFPMNVTSGTYSSVAFNLADSGIYNPAFITMQGGLSQAEAALISGIQNNETYLNIHTTMFTGGEIRGFLTVPEPSAVLLLPFGLVGCCLAFRRLRASWEQKA